MAWASITDSTALMPSVSASEKHYLKRYHAISGCDTMSAFRGNRQEVYLAGLEGVPRGDGDTQASGLPSFRDHKLSHGSFREAGENDCHPIRQDQFSDVCQRSQKGNPLLEEHLYGQNATDARCPTAAHPTGSVPSWDMDHQYTCSAGRSITTSICLDQYVRIMATSLDHKSRGLQGMQRVD
jgi:hypothetical protein